MSKRVIVWLVAVAALAPTAAGAERDPRLERLALRPADVQLARQAVLRASDLGSGWARVRAPASDPEAPDCPGYRPDFSRFTITGQADSQFSGPGGTSTVASHVEVYRTRADARGDFDLSTAAPVARCLGLLLSREAASSSEGFRFRLISSRRVGTPRLGERAAAYRIVSELSSEGTAIRVFLDVVIVLKGRSIGGVFFTGALRPVLGREPAVARMAARLR